MVGSSLRGLPLALIGGAACGVETGPAAPMAAIPGGSFRMGTDAGFPEEGPVHEVTVSPFRLDATEVTVGEFRAFVAATHYATTDERVGWGGVWAQGHWNPVSGASWQHPDGPTSAAPDDEPVVQVSYADASAYATWAHKRLPTEAEWEFAAHGGTDTTYPWGEEMLPGGKYLANFWQGSLSGPDEGKDGYPGRAPVGRFPPNGYGLSDMAGNVWEWVADWYDPDYYTHSPAQNPRGPDTGTERVIRGGSWLCSADVCRGFRVAARQHTPPDSGMSHLGFRCAQDAG